MGNEAERLEVDSRQLRFNGEEQKNGYDVRGWNALQAIQVKTRPPPKDNVKIKKCKYFGEREHGVTGVAGKKPTPNPDDGSVCGRFRFIWWRVGR